MTLCLRALSRDEVRQLDLQAVTKLALPTLVLMENAGRGAAGWLGELAGAIPPDTGGRLVVQSPGTRLAQSAVGPSPPKVLILCGPGNNGGDGAVVARHLNAWGFPVRVIWFIQSGQLRGDANAQWNILDRSGIEQSCWFDANSVGCELERGQLSEVVSQADWLVDAIFGTGLSRPVEDPFRSVIDVVNESAKPILALDLPSGLDADTGKPLGVAMRARATATFVATKKGFSLPGASNFTGEVAVIDIGLPRCLLEPYLIERRN